MIGIGSITLVLIIILVIYTLHGRSVRQKELDNGLSFGMEKAMEMLSADEYAPRSNEEFIALFLEAFLVNFESNSEVTINILQADYEKGLLSVEGILRYKHPIGTTGTVACVRTIILEEYVEEAKKTNFTIQYMVEGIVYKKYVLEEGTSLMIPANPEGDFLGWRALDGEEILDLEGAFVEENCTYVAVFQ